MSEVFDEFTTNEYEERSVDSVLGDGYGRAIYDSLSHFQNDREEYPYVEQLTKMLNDYKQTGYMTFLINFKDLPNSIQNFIKEDDSYYQFINSAQNAVNYLLYKTEKEYIKENVIDPFHVKDYDFDEICKHIPTISIRIKNFNYDLSVPDINKAIPIRAAKAASMSRLQVFKGIVVAINQSTIDLVKMKMTCNEPECGYVHTISFYEKETLTKTSKCGKCNKGGLTMSEPETYDVQTITLHDMNDAKSFSTSVQASLKCAVSQDLVNRIEIGDSVVVTGLQCLDLDDRRSKDLWNSKVKNNDYYVQMDAYRSRTYGVPFPKMLDVNYIEVIQSDDFSNFSNKLVEIQELQKRPDLYELLVKSFCPQIYGYEHVKEGLLLALVGGVGRNTTNGKIDKRGNIHVMIIADPSVGKSELLKYCAKLLKRGIYVSATSSSKVGLTGAATRDELSGKWMIEAGAILRANNSVLCIDEIGKLPIEAQSAIYEVAEQEQYTFNKAGILKTFDVNITLIVGGNPIDGRFDPDRTVAQNLGHFEAPFLSRFDAKYTLRDLPHEANDKNIVMHVMDQVNGEFDPAGLIPFDLLASYISYVRNYGIQPKLTLEAKKYLQEYYWSKRKNSNPDDLTQPAPISVREIEGVQRMCLARARLIFKEWVDVEDVKEVIKVHELMIHKIAYDPKTGHIDMANVNGTKSAYESSIEQRVITKLEEMIKQNGTNRVDRTIFMSACKVDNLASQKDIDNVLRRLDKNGRIKYAQDSIQLL